MMFFLKNIILFQSEVSSNLDLVNYKSMNGDDDDIINLSDFSCHIYFTESIQHF